MQEAHIRKRGTRDKPTSLYFFECMDRINRAIQSGSDLEEMMSHVLNEVLDIFDCERAYLLYPCNPDAESWRVPMESCRVNMPGANRLASDIPMDAQIAEKMRLLLEEGRPMRFGAGNAYKLPADIALRFGIKSIMATALHPETGQAWEFGIQQCSAKRIWTDTEERLLLEIGRRLSDGLSTQLVLRELQKSEQQFRSLAENSPDNIIRYDRQCRANYCNQMMRQSLSVDAALILGKTPLELEVGDPETNAEYEAHIRHVIKTGKSSDMEFSIPNPDGRPRRHLVRFAPERNAVGEIVGALAIGRDITERRQAEHRVELLSFALDSVHETAFLINEQGSFQYVNKEAGRALGYSREELLGMGVKDVDPDWPAEYWPEHWQMLKAQNAVTFEGRHRRKDGDTFPVEINANFFEFAGQQFNLALVRDITERKQAEAALAESEQQFRSLAENLPDNIVRYDRQGITVYVNPTLEKTLGVGAEMMLGTRVRKYYPDGSYELYAQAIDDALASGEDIEIEFHAPHPENKPWIHQIRFVVERDEQGEVTGVLAIGRDITARKLAEQEVERSQASLAEAQRIAKLGNFEVMHQQGCHLIWSDEMYKIHELDSDAFDGANEAFLASIHPEDRDRVEQTHYESVYGKQEGYELSYRLQMKDGRIKYVHEQGRNYLDGDGNPWRSIGTVQDVTKQQETELQLQQAQKMEALGTLVGGIAHDFNNKLAAITGNLYLARRQIEPDSKAGTQLKKVEMLSFEAADMVRQLLTFARQGKVEKEPIALAPFVMETAKLNRVAIPENIRLKITTGSDPLPVHGDITQLQSVLLNLQANARDALEGCSEPIIEIALSLFEPDESFFARHPGLAQEQLFARLNVSDNGSGIAPEKLEHIFDPFFTTKAPGKGTGLGLAMVYGIIEAHEGVIDVDSKPGEGTCFSIYLPINETLSNSDDNAEAEVIPGRGETILVADDDVHVLNTFTDVLKMLNYRVITANNGRDALTQYRQHADQINLVILDLVMPVMKGDETAREIRAIDPNAKILFSTGYGDQQAREFEDEINILDKPFVIERASRMIRETLEL